MLAALIWSGVRQGAPQRFPVERHLDMLLACFRLAEPPTWFLPAAACGLQPRQPVGEQLRDLVRVHSAQHIALGRWAGKLLMGHRQHLVQPVCPQAHPRGPRR